MHGYIIISQSEHLFFQCTEMQQMYPLGIGSYFFISLAYYTEC